MNGVEFFIKAFPKGYLNRYKVISLILRLNYYLWKRAGMTLEWWD